MLFRSGAAVDAVAATRPGALGTAGRRPGNRVKTLAWAYLLLIYAYLFLPSGLVGLMSFNSDKLSSFPLESLTLKWWTQMFGNETVLAAAKNSLVVAALTTVLATTLGVLTGYALVRYRFRLKAALTGMLVAVMLIPYLVVGIALLSFWALLGVDRGLHLVVLAHVALALPYSALPGNFSVTRETSLNPASFVSIMTLRTSP